MACRTLSHIHYVPESLATKLYCASPVIPVLYCLIKTHKSDFDPTSTEPSTYKVRPIISSCDGPTDRLSWLLSRVFSPLLGHVPSHLKNTGDFLTRLSQINSSLSPDQDVSFASFDVVNLYTNVSRDSALSCLSSILDDQYNNICTYGLSKRLLLSLTEVCLRFACFSWSGVLYEQKRGLAMGNRLAPILAILFMHSLERRSLYLNPILLVRYVDDMFIICNSSSQLQQLFDFLNGLDTHISLTRESPANNHLPFLNTSVSFIEGRFISNWYTKPSSSNIILNERSAHPPSLKRMVVTQYLNTVRSVSSDHTSESFKSSVQKATSILSHNGYTVRCDDSHTPHILNHSLHKHTRKLTHQKDACASITIPHISSTFTNSLISVLNKHDLPLRLVIAPPPTLRKLLVRNRIYDRACYNTKLCVVCPNNTTGDCCLKDVVYSIICASCGAMYVGETGRFLHERIREHVLNIKSPNATSYVNTPMAKHVKDHHNAQAVDITVNLLARGNGTTIIRKIREAFHIERLKPSINSCNELSTLSHLFNYDL